MTEPHAARPPGRAGVSRAVLLPALCLLLASALALGIRPSLAQSGFSDIDTSGLDSAARESLRIADSLAAQPLEDEFAQEEVSFGASGSILDRTRTPGPLKYNTNYNVIRSNRNWSQTADLYLTRGNLEIANVTTVTIGREVNIGRLNRNRSTKTELA